MARTDSVPEYPTNVTGQSSFKQNLPAEKIFLDTDLNCFIILVFLQR